MLFPPQGLALRRIEAIHQGVPITIEFDDHVYQPGPLTEILADLMEVRPGDRAVDAGCGTGYLGIMAALLGAAEVICTDPDPQAVRWTRHNARLNGVDRLVVHQARALDPAESLPVDLILSIPPQMPFHRDFNSQRHGGTDGTDVLMRIVSQAREVLRPTGRMFLLHAALADPRKVRQHMRSLGFAWRILRTVERELQSVEAEQLTPGLCEYILDLHRAGRAELHERQGRWVYPLWFYRVQLSSP
jgi:release factor glutamine methyltransferase